MTKKERQQAGEDELRKNPVNQFTCCEKTMVFEDFKKHLSEVHKLDPTKIIGKKSMLMHMDGDYWFSYNWQWELESGLKFTQYTQQVRAADDMMRFN